MLNIPPTCLRLIVSFCFLFMSTHAANAQSNYDGALFDTSCQGGTQNNKYQSIKKTSHFSSLWNTHSIEGAVMFAGVDVSNDEDDGKPKKPGSAANYRNRSATPI